MTELAHLLFAASMLEQSALGKGADFVTPFRQVMSAAIAADKAQEAIRAAKELATAITTRWPRPDRDPPPVDFKLLDVFMLAVEGLKPDDKIQPALRPLVEANRKYLAAAISKEQEK
jgi:hypothetical protein